MFRTVRSAVPERDWAMVAGSYAMHPPQRPSQTSRDRPAARRARRDKIREILGLEALLRSTALCPALR